MDQRVIRVLKAFYRTDVVGCQIKYIDAGKTTPKINILEAMSMLVKLWDTVLKNTAKNCFRKAAISQEIRVAAINAEHDPFKLLEENVNGHGSFGLVDEDFAVDDYINIDFEICASETIAITDRDLLDSILINDCAEVEEEIDDESNDLPHDKPKLSEIVRAIELLKCWSLFDNNDEIRQLLTLVSKMFDKHFLETKTQLKMDIFFKKLYIICYFTRKRLKINILFRRSSSFELSTSVKVV